MHSTSTRQFRVLALISLALVGAVVAAPPLHACQDVPGNPNRWCDGFDGLDVGQFSIMIGNGTGLSEKEKPSIRRVSTIEVRTQRGNFSGQLDCYTPQGQLTEHLWTNMASPLLPWTLDIHSGHACSLLAFDAAYDNMWINYSNQHINVRGDDRCWHVNMYSYRCVLLERPEEAASEKRREERRKERRKEQTESGRAERRAEEQKRS